MTNQLALFDEERELSGGQNAFGIPGLRYISGFVSPDEQARVLAAVDGEPWQHDLSRRVQHYGYKYNYKSRRVDETMFVGELPQFAVELGKRLYERQLVTQPPDQVIVNEYKPGQGIAMHVDCEPCFGDYIVTVSFGSVYIMDLLNTRTNESIELSLALGSALVLSGDSRYKWKHGIKARKSDHGRARGRRVSLTFRKVILESERLHSIQ